MVNDLTIEMVKGFEGLLLESKQPVPGDPWTLGYGRTKGIMPSMKCTKKQAEEWLLEDLKHAEEIVLSCVNVDLTDNQYGALVSFVYNVGNGIAGVKDGLCHLKSGGPSHLLQYVNLAQFDKAADEFLKWDRSHGVEYPGLKARREKERALFLTKDNHHVMVDED